MSDRFTTDHRSWSPARISLPVTKALIGINIAVYLAGMIFPGVFQHFAFAPILGYFEPWRFLSTAFLHNGVLHIVLNMYALWIAGNVLERFLRWWRYLLLYLLSALGGSVLVLLFAGNSTQAWVQATVGASGAIFGIFGAIVVIQRRLGGDATQIMGIIIINMILSFVVPNISWVGHLGGLLTGVVVALSYTRTLERPMTHRARNISAIIASALIFAVLVTIAWAKYAATFG